ncbi:hypothetical protein Tco_1433507 [Tanacetum coccineum]
MAIIRVILMKTSPFNFRNANHPTRNSKKRYKWDMDNGGRNGIAKRKLGDVDLGWSNKAAIEADCNNVDFNDLRYRLSVGSMGLCSGQ